MIFIMDLKQISEIRIPYDNIIQNTKTNALLKLTLYYAIYVYKILMDTPYYHFEFCIDLKALYEMIIIANHIDSRPNDDFDLYDYQFTDIWEKCYMQNDVVYEKKYKEIILNTMGDSEMKTICATIDGGTSEELRTMFVQCIEEQCFVESLAYYDLSNQLNIYKRMCNAYNGIFLLMFSFHNGLLSMSIPNINGGNMYLHGHNIVTLQHLVE